MKDKKTDDLLYPENTDFAAAPDEVESAEEYLGFVSNGMTNNEKIDEYNYFEHYLDEETDRHED